VRELFGDKVTSLACENSQAEFVHHDTAALCELCTNWFGPVAARWVALDGHPRRR
jgi:hypothetical protein